MNVNRALKNMQVLKVSSICRLQDIKTAVAWNLQAT